MYNSYNDPRFRRAQAIHTPGVDKETVRGAGGPRFPVDMQRALNLLLGPNA